MMKQYIAIISLLFLLAVSTSHVIAQQADFLENYPDCEFDNTEADAGLQLGIVAINMDNRLGCVQNFDTTFNVASVPKVFIAAAYYNGLIEGTYSVSGSIQFTRNYWMAGSNDCLREEDIGTTYTYNELIEFMINCSDNAATWMLMDALGWQRVNAYVQSLGIDGIGEVIPYSEVDRLKLAFLDETWSSVPAGIASRFYRRGLTAGLLDYFDEIPNRPSRTEFIRINQRYFDDYSYNTVTPRALANFFLQMRDNLINGTAESAFIANNVFNVMLFTQRQYSVQALPGTTYIGSKNGFDRGLLAEVNILFDDLEQRIPSGIVLVFGQYESLSDGVNNAQLPNRFGDALNDLFFALSPSIRDTLYPNLQEAPARRNFMVSTIIFNEQSTIQTCWNPFFASDFDPSLVFTVDNCFSGIRPRLTYPVDENLAFGMTLQSLNFQDTRFTFIYTAPDNRQFSYQIDRSNVTASAIYWFHPLDMPGQWQVDIYINLDRVHTETILAQR